MTKNYDESVDINHNLSWSYIPCHLYRILMNNEEIVIELKKHQRPDDDKIYLYVKDKISIKVSICINGRGNKYEKKSKAIIDYSQKICDVSEN